MTLLAVTVIGHDRTGIIADVTGRLATVGGNLEDSSMTLLRGHFAMTLVVATEAGAQAVEQALAPVAADGSLLVTVREVPEEEVGEPSGAAYVLTVHGGDRPGIVSSLTSVVAGAGGNITDLTTRLTGDLYLVVAEVDLPPGCDVAALTARLEEVAAGLGVTAHLRAAEADLL